MTSTGAQKTSGKYGIAAAVLMLLLMSGAANLARAETPLEVWRNEIASVRKLAENDAALAFKKAQNLEAALPANATPIDRAKALNVLARTELYIAQTSAAANHAQLALNLAKQYADRVGQAEAYLSMSLNAVNEGRVDVIVDASPRALEILQGVDNPALLSEAMMRLAMMYLRLGQLDATVTLCMQTMDVAKRSNDPLALLYAHQGLGIAFNNNGRYAEAHEHFTQMRDLARALQLRQPEGEAISGMAFTQAKLGDWRTAVLMHREAIAIFRSVGVPFNTAHALYSLADTLRQHGLLTDSLQTFGEAIAIYRHYPNQIGLWWALNARSENNQVLKNFASAKTDAEQAYALAQKMSLPLYRAESAKRMAALAAASGEHKRAYQFATEAADLSEQMTREKSSARMVELAQRYQGESKQRKIDELTRNEQQRALERRWLWTILGGSIILLAGIGYFLLRLRRSHRLLQTANAQLRLSQDETRALNIELEQRVQASTAELRQQTRYLRTLFDTLPISVWLKDTEGRYLTINTSHVAVKGLTAEQMLGKTDEELWPGEIGAAFRAADVEVMETRHRKTQELAIPGENGAIFWREIDKAPVIDDDGSVIGTVGVGRDISERKRYEQSLLAQAKLEQRLSALTANIPGFVYTIRLDADGHASFPFASAGVEEIFGLRPEEIRNDANVLRARYHPDDLPRMLNVMEESERTLKPFHAEIRIRNRNNEERWVEVRSIPQRQPDGSTEWHGIMLDITERKLVEQQLKQALNFSEGIINAIPDILFEVDRNGKYLNVWTQNPELLAAQKEALLGKTAQEVLSPEAAAVAMEAIREADDKGVSVARDMCIDLPNGRRWFAHSMAKKPGNTAADATFMVWSRDITERKRMEETLEAREREFRALAESSPGMMGSFYLRPDGSVCMPYVSPNIYDLFGLRPQDVAEDASSLLMLNHPDDAQRVRESIAESARTMTVWHQEYRILHPTKGERWMESNTNPQPHPDGGTVWYGYVFDITERKRAEEVLRFIAQGEWMNSGEVFLNALARYLGNMLNVDYVLIDKIAADPAYAESVALYAKGEVVPNMRYALKDTPCANVISGSLCCYPENIQALFPEDTLLVEMGAESYAGLPLWDTKGNAIGLIAVLDSSPMEDINLITSILQLVATSAASELKRSQMEQVLRESHESLREAQRISHVGNWELDLVGGRLQWSDEIYRIFEITPEKFGASYGDWLNFIHPEDREGADRAYTESVKNHTPYELEHRLLLADGKIKHVLERCETVYDQDGKALRSIGTVQDITERKQMEAALQDSEARYRQNYNLLQSMLESSSSISVYALDREYRLLAFNRKFREAAKRLWGADIAVGMNILEVIDTDEHREFFRKGAERVLEGHSYSLDSKEAVIKDGGTVYEYHENYGAPIYSDSGEVSGLTVFAITVTERKEAEQKLKEALEFNEGVISAIPDLLFELDRNGKYLNVWAHTPELLAAQQETLLNSTVHDVLPAESAAMVMQSLREADERGVSFGNVIQINLPQGASWFELSVSKKPGGSPADATFLVLSRDITARKNIEAALNESEARYRSNYNLLKGMLESTTEITFFALDREYRYLAFNAAHRRDAKALWGTDIELGKNWLEGLHTANTEEHREFCKRGFDQVLAGNSFSIESTENVIQEDGRIAPQYFDNFGTPIRNETGEVIGLTIFSVNITERKKLEAELRASRNFLDSVIDSVSDPIFVKDRQHRWTLLNDAFCNFVGKPREALLGKSDYDFFPEEEADVFWAKDELVFESGESNLNEENFTSADGEAHYIQTKKTPFISGDGREMLVGIIRDITDLKHYEAAREAALAEAVRLAKSRSEFLAHMSHELRTPLNGILGYTQILQRNKGLGERNADALNVIRQSGEHLLALVEDILDLARIEAGRFKLDVGDIALATFLRVVTDIIRVRAKEKNIEFVSDFARDLPAGIKGDDKRLRQVLLNLLSNAVKFTEKGRVVLHVSRVTPSRLAFRVEDTGMGIPANELETIFQPFEQSGDTQQRFGGSGLGLSISRKLVRLMGGDITVESKLGEGSTFRFELELPEVQIAPAVLLSAPIDGGQTETSTAESTSAESLILPPAEELQTLHHLAQLGNMRDIIQYAERIAAADSRCQPFSEHLRRMAEGYQSKAILAFVEEHLNDTKE